MIDLRKIAKKAVVFSELMNGRDKIETADIIKYYKDKITIVDADPVRVPDEKNENGYSDFYVYLIEEEPNKFAFSGMVLNKIFDQIFTACGGDIETFHKELKSQKLKLKLSTGKTKDSDREITLVEVI